MASSKCSASPPHAPDVGLYLFRGSGDGEDSQEENSDSQLINKERRKVEEKAESKEEKMK